ncbi:MAG: hypothetical protein AB7O43_19840 [Hyphomicrobiaceae bacterium]
MTADPGKPPFQRHRIYYLALKIIVLLAAIYLAVRYLVPLIGS